MSENNFKVYTLKNGLRIWYAPNNESKRLDVGFWVLGGMATETEDTLEYYHFMEHMAADFTSSKYSDGSANNKNLKSIGVDLEGEVVENTMHVWMQGHSGAAKTMIDMCIHTLLDYKMDPRRLEQERESIITELHGYMNDPFYVMDEYRESKIHPGHVMASTLKRRIRSVKAATMDGLVDFFKSAVSTERTVVYLSGNVPNAGAVLRNMKTQLSKMKKVKPFFELSTLRNYTPRITISPGIHTVYNREANTQKIQIIWPTINIDCFDSKQRHFEALELILKTRLFDLLRIQLGMIYHVKLTGSHYDMINPRLSFFQIEMEVSLKRHIKPSIENTLHFITNPDNITETDLMQAKREDANSYEDQRLDHRLESVWEYSQPILMKQRIVSPKERHEQFQKIELQDLRDTIKTYLDPSKAYTFVCCERPVGKR